MTNPRSERVRPCPPSCAPRSRFSDAPPPLVKRWGVLAFLTLSWFAPASFSQLTIRSIPAQKYDLASDIAASLKPKDQNGFRFANRTVHIPSGTHILTAPIDLRGAYGAMIEAEAGAVLVFQFDAPAAFDMRGAANCVFRDLVCASTGKIGTAFFAARDTSGWSAGFHMWEHCKVEGNYLTAPLVWAASECNVARNCQFYQSGRGSCLWIGDYCPTIALPHADQTMLESLVDNCFLGSQGGGPLVTLSVDGRALGDLQFRSGGGSTLLPTPAVFDVLVGSHGGQVDGITIDGPRYETEHASTFVRIASQAPAGWGANRWRFSGTAVVNGPFATASGIYLREWSASALKAQPVPPYSQQPQRVAVIAADPLSAISGFPLGNAAHLYCVGQTARVVEEQPR